MNWTLKNLLLLFFFLFERQCRKPVWIHLKYVKLLSVCYNCGMISHDSKLCPNRKECGSVLYGKWLRTEDQSWNVPEWPENSASISSFKTVTIRGLVTTSVFSDTVRESRIMMWEKVQAEKPVEFQPQIWMKIWILDSWARLSAIRFDF